MAETPIEHIPVLAEVLAGHLTFSPDAVVVDATLGQAGHSLQLGRRLGPQGCLVGFDLDERAIATAQERLACLECRVILCQTSFANVRSQLTAEGLGSIDFLLADLGISSVQLADDEMGLSFQSEGPLDMRIDRSLTVSAADIVNKTSERELADIIYQYGEDRASRRIARFIVAARERQPIETTGALAALVSKALYRPGSKGRTRIHPATRTFQALRIAVNHELDNLKQLLMALPHLLRSGGRAAIMSFHSLEDRMVKQDFRAHAGQGVYRLLTKKPQTAGDQEVVANPRARSAKLRVAEKV